MRPIKYQAYKPHHSLSMKPGMYEVSTIDWYDKPFQGHVGEVFYKGYKTSDYLEDINLRQFTGLLDKNGKEIYEGDILQFLMKLVPKSKKVKAYVVWDEAGATYQLNFSDTHFTGFADKAPFGVEVVGNVWENGDLLK